LRKHTSPAISFILATFAFTTVTTLPITAFNTNRKMEEVARKEFKELMEFIEAYPEALKEKNLAGCTGNAFTQ
jgi:hypothetical protein